ncbi:MAG: antitoxin [Myxococcales bacterium]
MRTTLTIDDDLMRDLRDEAHRTGVSLKVMVNRTLRTGMNARNAARPEPYRCPTFSMGHPSGTPLDKALQLASELEDEETARKLVMRK